MSASLNGYKMECRPCISEMLSWWIDSLLQRVCVQFFLLLYIRYWWYEIWYDGKYIFYCIWNQTQQLPFHRNTDTILHCELWGGLFLFTSPGSGRPEEDWRSAARRLRGELAEAAACGGVWRRRHDPHSQEEASCTTAAGPGWGYSFSIHKYSSLMPGGVALLRHASVFWGLFFPYVKVD